MYRKIQTGTWDDPRVRSLPPLAKLLFLYTFSNRNTHVSGIYILPDVVAQVDTGIPYRKLAPLWDTLSGLGLLKRDPETDVIWVCAMFRHQGSGEKNERSAAAQLATLHNSFLIRDFLEAYPSVEQYLGGVNLDRVSAPRLQEQEQEQDREQEQKKENTLALSARASDGNGLVAGFEKFWKAYPKKRGKQTALKAFKALGKRRPPLETLLEAVEAQARSHDWTKEDGKFVPHPQRWLKEGRWDDEVGTAAPSRHERTDSADIFREAGEEGF